MHLCFSAARQWSCNSVSACRSQRKSVPSFSRAECMGLMEAPQNTYTSHSIKQDISRKTPSESQTNFLWWSKWSLDTQHTLSSYLTARNQWCTKFNGLERQPNLFFFFANHDHDDVSWSGACQPNSIFFFFFFANHDVSWSRMCIFNPIRLTHTKRRSYCLISTHQASQQYNNEDLNCQQ